MCTTWLRACIYLVVLLLPFVSQSQSLPSKSDRLVQTCKVWGYIKYFHPGASGCINNMDSVLLKSIAIADTATSSGSYERGLLQLFEQAGPIPVATKPEVKVDTINKLNLDLRWHQSSTLPASVRSRLDSIRVNFRPFANCYFKSGGNETVYLLDEEDYPDSVATSSSYPLLLLFRAWNVHNYYSPYKRLIEPSWDTALADLIPHFASVSSVLDLHLAFTRYQSRQRDAHSSSISTVLTEHFGSRYLPCLLALVEGKTVITKVFSGVDDLRVGDVVVKIDGTPVQMIRDSLRPYVHGGAQEIIDRNISTYLLRGQLLECTLEVENTDGIRTVTLQRSSNAVRASDSLIHPRGDGHVSWKVLPGNIGYVNGGLLTVAEVPEMYQDLRSSKAIIFDIRNYPNEFVLYAVADLLLQSRRAFCNFYFPNPTSPGTFTGRDLYCGPTTSNPNYYRGEVRILQNQVTQSSAEFHIMAWQTHPNAKIIGSQTAGADGNVSTLAFPTGLSLKYSGCGVLYPDRRETQIVGIEEDITVTPTLEGIREGRDELLEAALNSISVGKVEQLNQPDFVAMVSVDAHLTLTLPGTVESANLTIYDMIGRQVFAQPYIGTPLDIAHLSDGSYLLELTSNGTMLRSRFTK